MITRRPVETRRRRLMGVAAVAALVGVALAVWLLTRHTTEPTTTTPEKLSPTQAVITGHVTDAESHAPIEGAVVTVDHAGGPLTVRTDGRGAYRAVLDVSRPIALTIDAPGHQGEAAFGKLCPGERRDLPVDLTPAHDNARAPAAPMVLEERCR